MFPAWLSVVGALLIAQSQPTFRTRVELLRLDVSVVDKSGQPVRDLRAEDFVVRVDGKPRPVSFARFYGPDGGRSQPAPTAPPSFATNTTTAVPGRVVVFVVDLESMTPGYEKLVLDTAGSLIDRLGPADSVGLLLIPGKGIELTRDHARVREALQRARGFATDTIRHGLTVREAEAFHRNDAQEMRYVIERECRPSESTCPDDLRREARELLMLSDRRIRDVLHTLTDLNARLAYIDQPRTIVLLSAGLPYRADSESYFRDLRRGASESGTTTYVIQLDQPEFDAGSRSGGGMRRLQHTDLADGLSNVAGVTGGSMFSGIGRALGVFDRIQSEIVHTYQLGVESTLADGDGKTHKIDVQVRRTGAIAKARTEFIVPTDPPRPRTLPDAMALPPGLAEIPLTATVYSTRGEEPTTLKLVVVLETSAGQSAAAPSYAFTITGREDRPVFETSGEMTAGARATFGAQVAPGTYRLRAAIVDAQGHAGSVEAPVAVGLRQVGSLQASDLIVGHAGERFAPASRIEGSQLTAMLELYAVEAAHFDGLEVDLELRADNAPAILARGSATVAQTSLERRRIAQGTLDVPDALAPGTYVLSAVVKRHGQPLARISRALVR